MELKVWVEGIQRIVCGVTENTTCQDVVYALAHATGRTGRFTLTERWRNNERLLAPQEHPLKVLMKWGEYSNDVQFILHHNGSSQNSNTSSAASSDSSQIISPERNKDMRKSQTFSSQHRNENTAIIKGVLRQNLTVETKSKNMSPVRLNDDRSYTSSPNSKVSVPSPVKCNTDLASPHSQLFGTPLTQNSNNLKKTPPSYRDPPNPSTHHLRTLPPYREPPPPVSSVTLSPNLINNSVRVSPRFTSPNELSIKSSTKRLLKEYEIQNPEDSLGYSPQYRDLVRLINYQRDKLSAQQAELTKYDAEIIYWETKTKEQQHQMDILYKDAAKVDAALKQVDEQLRSFGTVEEEMDLVKQQDRTLKSELTLLRSKLANCETELLLCKNKIRLLLDEIKMEQRILSREADERNHIERSMLAEVDRLQTQVEQAKHDAEMAAQIGDTLHKEVAILEATINEKKRHVEELVNDMKEANLQSLAISPPEELKMILDGAQFSKPGSTRRMIGSPRQLENAVPTSKNPHGVWV